MTESKLTPEMEAEVRAFASRWSDMNSVLIQELRALLSEIDALRTALNVRDEALREVRQWIGDGQFSDGLARAHWTPEYAAVVDLVDAIESTKGGGGEP